MTKLSPDFYATRRAKMVSLKLAGKSFRQIAAILDVPIHIVQHAMAHAKKEGVQTGNDGFWTEEKWAELLRWWTTTTLSQSLIAKNMGIGKGAVVGKVKRNTMPPRPNAPMVRLPAGPHTARSATPMVARKPVVRDDHIPVHRVRHIIAQKPSPRDPHKKCVHTSGERGAWVNCEETVVLGKPFCPAHYATCVQRPNRMAAE